MVLRCTVILNVVITSIKEKHVLCLYLCYSVAMEIIYSFFFNNKSWDKL